MRKFYSILTLVFLSVSLFAQSPQKMSYQAVIRNTNDQLVSNKSVGMRISILQGSVSGAEVYKEIYNPNPQTNANGLVTVEIGSGVALVGTFSGIDWSAGPYFIKTETDPTGGTSYTVTGTSELLSVPYALYAKTAENGFSGSYNDLTNQPDLFDGQYSSLTGTPILANVATSGSYADLSSKPAIFDGAYSSLTGKPVLFDGNYNSLTNRPSLFDGAYSSLTGIPTFATVATTGSYNSLSNKPSLFSGAFVDLSGKPTTISGYGITNAMSISHAANGITTGDITSWNNKLSSYTETDPVFVLWNKSSGIHITASQVSDFATSVTNNPAMVANSAKISYPTADAAKLAAISGTNTGDETTASIKTKLGIVTLSGSNTGDNSVNSLYSGLVTNVNHTGEVTGSNSLTIANKITMTGASPVIITGTPTVIASSPVVVSILPATVSLPGSMSASDKTKLDGITPGAEVNVNPDWNATSSDAQILNKPTTIVGYGITDAVTTTGNQTIAGNKTFNGTTTVITPVNATDAVNKAYVDDLEKKVELLNGKIAFLAKESNSYATSDTSGIVADVEDNSYQYIIIGSQTWMEENLKTTKYSDGTAIPYVTDNVAWNELTTGGYCWYNNNPVMKNTYGGYYNWYTVVDGHHICPFGWHVPTEEEWVTLESFLGGAAVAGGKLKSTGTIQENTGLWKSPNSGADNSSGFTALPGGYRNYDGAFYGQVGQEGDDAGFWTTTNVDSRDARSISLYNYWIQTGHNSYWKKAGSTIRCVKDTDSTVVLPTLSTTDISVITATSATTGGSIIYDGGGAISAKGVCWSTTLNPTISNSKTIDGSGTGIFISSISGMRPGTLYYVRAYATNSVGTAYGNQVSFSTDPLTVSDVEGNTYNVVRIGTQVWMKENLKTTSFNGGGLSLDEVKSDIEWGNLSTLGYCWHDNNIANKIPYGALYNWSAVNTGKLCPVDWHIPTDADWYTLENFIDPTIIDPNAAGWRGVVAGGKLKEVGTTHWSSPNYGATNETGFTALPGGFRNNNGLFDVIGVYGYWWSSSVNGGDAWHRDLKEDNSLVWRTSSDKRLGLSVRCLKD